MNGAYPASVQDQQLAQGLAVIPMTGCSAKMVTKVARAESGINTTQCSLSALCSKPCGKGQWPLSLCFGSATGLQIHGRRRPGCQCQPWSSEKEEQTSQDFSPGHKEKPCCLAWSLEEC